MITTLETKIKATQVLEKISVTHDYQHLEFLLSELLDNVRDTLQSDRVVIYFNQKIMGESLLFGWESMLGLQLKPREIGNKLITISQQGEISTNSALFSVKFIESYDIKSSVTVPIFLNEKLFGLMMVHYCADLNPVQDKELDYLEKFVQKLEFALEKSDFLNCQNNNFLTTSINSISNLFGKIKLNWAS